MVRDKASFERLVGRIPCTQKSDEKVLQAMRMYESHREKMERDIERYERELDKASKRIVEIES